MDMNDYIKSDHYAAVVETDHGVLINGMSIPFVVQDGVKCEDAKSSLHFYKGLKME